MHLAVYPDLDPGSIANVMDIIRRAEKREAEEERSFQIAARSGDEQGSLL